jgi:hypothetical protein
LYSKKKIYVVDKFDCFNVLSYTNVVKQTNNSSQDNYKIVINNFVDNKNIIFNSDKFKSLIIISYWYKCYYHI